MVAVGMRGGRIDATVAACKALALTHRHPSLPPPKPQPRLTRRVLVWTAPPDGSVLGSAALDDSALGVTDALFTSGVTLET